MTRNDALRACSPAARWRLTKDRHLAFGHLEPAGRIVERCYEHDYGLCRDDFMVTGREHVFVKPIDADGGPFTVPVDELEPVASASERPKGND